MTNINPFHDGELAVQKRTGQMGMARNNGRVISDTIIGGAQGFIEQQPMVVVSSMDDKADPDLA